MSAALGIDIGTTNVKAVLVDGNGAVVASSQRALATSRSGDTAEQDAGELLSRTADAIVELTADHPDVALDVVAVGVCSQYSSIVPVAADTTPVGPLLMWSDHRGTDHSWNIISEHETAFGTWIDKHGIPTVGGGLALAHILHFQHDRPGIHEATAAYLEPMDFVTARLTGNITATQHSMFMSQLCDNRNLSVTTYDDELVRMSGVDARRLPALIDSDAVVGTLTGEMANELGLPTTAVVHAGSNDTAMLGVAAGVSKPGRGGLAIGTTSVLVDSVADKNTDLDHEILSMPALSAEQYLVFAENGNGGRLVEHMLDELVYPNDSLAAHGTTEIFDNLDSVLAETAAGADGVLFLPWLAGSLAPSANPNMRGGFINMSFASRRVDLVRSVTEGVAHNLAWLLPHVEAFTGSAIDELAFFGGAARSPQWCQGLADILDRPIAAATDPDTAVARSVARLALARSGVLDRAQVEAGVELDPWREPNPAHRAVYQVHQEQFEAGFEALRPISEALTAFHSGVAEQFEAQGDNQ